MPDLNKKTLKKTLRILHAPVNSAGQAYLISRAQRKLGFKSDVIVFYQNFLDYENDKNLEIDKKPIFYRELIMFWNFLQCLFSYDVFHFHCGLSLLPYHWDLPILRFFKKKTIMEYWGTDLVQIDVAKKYSLWEDGEFKEIYPKIDDEKQRQKITQIFSLVDEVVVGSYALTPLAPKSKVINKAIDLEKASYVGLDPQKKIPLIVHVPTNRLIKGTDEIIKTMQGLKKENLKFKFILVENKAHREALEYLKKADIIIDQIKIGYYGTLAVECMALGKPVVCYLRPELNDLPDCPIVNANSITLYRQLKKLILNPALRTEIGRKGRNFVEKHHDSLKIARQFIDLYNQISYKTEKFSIRHLKENQLPYINDPLYLENHPWATDNEGIVIFKYQGKIYYNPVQIAEKIIYFLNKKKLKETEKFAQKLIDISQELDGALFFPYQFDFYLHGIEKEKMTAPWYSGMAQGQALTVFVRLYKMTKKRRYFLVAQKIFQSFKYFYGSHNPWICYSENNHLWIEEYPMTKPGHTLNGFNYAIFGLYDYWLLTNDSNCRNILLGSLTTIKENIGKFRQAGDISLYCLKHRRKSAHYHQVHIKQLKMFYKMTGDKYFQEMAKKFYDDSH